MPALATAAAVKSSFHVHLVGALSLWRLVAWATSHDQPETRPGQALVEERSELRIEVFGADGMNVFDAAGAGDSLDVECGSRPAPGVMPDSRMRLEARGDRRAIVEDHHQDVAPLVDGVDDCRQCRVEERRVAEEGDRPLTDPGPGQTFRDADRRADRKLGVDAIGDGRQAAGIGDQHRVLSQPGGHVA